MIFSKNFKKIITDSEETLRKSKVLKLAEHIRSYSFVKFAEVTSKGISIKLTEEVVEPSKVIATTFIKGGQLRKKSSLSKDKVDAKDFFFIKKFEG